MIQLKAHPEWKLLFEQYKNSTWRVFIPHKDIEGVIGITRKLAASKYYGIVNRWKKAMLEEAGKQIECISSEGYQIIKPEEFRTSATRQMKFGHKRIKKAGQIIVKTPMDLLEDDEKRKVIELGNLAATFIHFSKTTMKKVKQIDKKIDQLLLDVGKALDVGD
jgi:hypothetical protein